MNDNQLTNEEKDQLRLKEMQLTQLKLDLVKHISTLSSGSIVILATFLTKGPPPLPASSRYWLLLSVISLVTCLVTALAYFLMFGLVRRFVRLDHSPTGRRIEFGAGLLVSLAFCCGIFFLGGFVIKSLP